MADAPDAPENAGITLQGPVRLMDGRFVLCVPLAAGGDKFIECTQGISKVQDGVLYIVVDRFAGTLRLVDGDLVTIRNADGKFSVRSAKPGAAAAPAAKPA